MFIQYCGAVVNASAFSEWNPLGGSTWPRSHFNSVWHERDGSLLKEAGNQHTGCSVRFVSVLAPSRSIAIRRGGETDETHPQLNTKSPPCVFLTPQFLQFSTYQFIQRIWDHRSHRQAVTPSPLPLIAKHGLLMDRMVYYNFNHSWHVYPQSSVSALVPQWPLK